MVAAREVSVVIANGADVNAMSRYGSSSLGTPLGWAENYPQKYPGIRAIFDKHGIKYGRKLKAFKAAVLPLHRLKTFGTVEGDFLLSARTQFPFFTLKKKKKARFYTNFKNAI